MSSRNAVVAECNKLSIRSTTTLTSKRLALTLSKSINYLVGTIPTLRDNYYCL